MTRADLIHAVAVARQEALPSRWCDLDEDEQRAMIELVESDLNILDRLLPGLLDVTPHEALEVWRARYYETRAECDRLREAMRQALLTADQPHYGCTDTQIDHMDDAVAIIRKALEPKP